MTNPSLRTLVCAAASRSIQTTAANLGSQPWEIREESLPSSINAAADRLSVAATLAGALTGELILSLSRDEIEALHGPSSASSSASADPQLAWQQTAQAIAEQLCLDLGRTLGQVSLLACRSKPADAGLEPLGTVVLRSHDEVTAVTIVLAADPVLARHLSSPPAPDVSPLAASLPHPATIDRVIDVQLAVTIRFGQRHLTLRELLDLNAGSLLELDRQVEEPVDLMLGERVIARGEVVIVDGNYGMRITEVLENHTRGADRERAQPLSYARA